MNTGSEITQTIATRRPTTSGIAGSLGLSAAAFVVLGILITLAGEKLGALSGGAPKLDFLWLAPPETYRQTLDRYGDAGRQFYFWMNWLDMLFPLSLAWFGSLLLKRSFGIGGRLAFAPMLFALLDIAENGLLFLMLAQWPAFSDRLATACSAVTALKLIALGLSYLFMAAALLLSVVRWFRRRLSAAPTPPAP
jgi:hypothetical protein